MSSSNGYVDKSVLLAPHLEEKDVTAGKKKFRIRQLSHGEVLDISATAADLKGRAFEAQFFASSLVQPAMTHEEAVAWLTNASSVEVSPIVAAIADFSGLRGNLISFR